MKALKTFACAVAVTLSFATAAMAGGDLSPADNKAMHDYTLSMDKINAMGAAVGDMKNAEAANPALAKQIKAVGDSSKSIAEMVSKTNATPQLMAIYKAHGLNATDAVLMPFVLMYAATAAQYPAAAPKLAAQTSPAQIAFYKQHQKEMQAQKWLSGQ
jgi:hypothetical protein